MEPDWATFHPIVSVDWTEWGFIHDVTVDREGRVWMVGITEGGLDSDSGSTCWSTWYGPSPPSKHTVGA